MSCQQNSGRVTNLRLPLRTCLGHPRTRPPKRFYPRLTLRTRRSSTPLTWIISHQAGPGAGATPAPRKYRIRQTQPRRRHLSQTRQKSRSLAAREAARKARGKFSNRKISRLFPWRARQASFQSRRTMLTVSGTPLYPVASAMLKLILLSFQTYAF